MQRKKVNIILLNYNGKDLLKKYLASVVEAAKNSAHDCRVGVIDNKSTDGSCEFINKEFPGVDLYRAEANKVLCSYNDYLKTIDDDIVIFLNTDIRVDRGFVDPLIGHFKHEDVFFVAPKEFSMDNKYQGNLNRIQLKFGVLSTVLRDEGYHIRQHTVSVHGGAFDRRKFLYLGGYDDIYLPGIVEDLDLCYRGWKHGWKGIYEPESFYYHETSTSFNREYGKSGKLQLAHRNSFLFFWKNITSGRFIFLHIICIPLLLLAALLRGRMVFVRGFFQAVGMLPAALERRAAVISQFKLSDEEAIRRTRLPYQSITEPPQTNI